MRQKNQQGLSNLYDNYSGAVFGIIYRTLPNKSIAEEVLQQTMLKAWQKIETYDSSKSSLFTWLSTIARNTAIDKRRLKSFEMNQKTDSLDTHVYHASTSQKSGAKIDVERLTKNLDEKYKTVLDLMYLQGYSHSEISEKLDIPLGTIKTRLRTAVKILREELKHEKSFFMGIFLMILILMLWFMI